uniref:Uncharacterized protein n=1 Tax=Cacopsylla melanoneura TaxID=428564 RepID=A0A8D8WFQ1_9HEMI
MGRWLPENRVIRTRQEKEEVTRNKLTNSLVAVVVPGGKPAWCLLDQGGWQQVQQVTHEKPRGLRFDPKGYKTQARDKGLQANKIYLSPESRDSKTNKRLGCNARSDGRVSERVPKGPAPTRDQQEQERIFQLLKVNNRKISSKKIS